MWATPCGFSRHAPATAGSYEKVPSESQMHVALVRCSNFDCSHSWLQSYTALCWWYWQLSQCAVYVYCTCQGLVYFFYLYLVRPSREIDEQSTLFCATEKTHISRHSNFLPVARGEKQKLEFRLTTNFWISDIPVDSSHAMYTHMAIGTSYSLSRFHHHTEVS